MCVIELERVGGVFLGVFLGTCSLVQSEQFPREKKIALQKYPLFQEGKVIAGRYERMFHSLKNIPVLFQYLGYSIWIWS